MSWFSKRRWLVPGLACALAVACAADENKVGDPDVSHRGGSAGAGGKGGSGGNGGSVVTAGTNSGGSAATSANAGTGGSVGTAGTEPGAGGDPGAGGEPGSSGSGGTGGNGGTGGGGTGGGGTGGGGTGGKGGTGGGGTGGGCNEEPAGGASGSGGDGGMAGSGGSNPMCSDGIKNGTESHVDCDNSGGECGPCEFPLTRYVIGNTGDMGTVKMTWDATNLYILFKINDTTEINNNSGLHWQNDSVEIYLDLNNGKTGTYEADDYQLTIARDVADTEIQGNDSANEGMIVVVKSSNACGYTIDVTVPWAALDGATAPLGEDIGFDFAVNNDTNGDDNRDSQIMVFGNDQNFNNTSQFGTITLN